MAVIVANKTGNTDGVAHSFLQNVQSKMPIVLISRANDFVFNDDLLALKGKSWALCCFMEYGWRWDEELHYWGINSHEFDFMQGDEWEKFDDFIRDCPPAVTLKRELLQDDACDTLRPIEYPSIITPIPIQSKEEFNNRPLSAVYYFGRSHEERLRIHSDVWRNASKYGYSVCDNLYYFNGFMANETGKKYASFHIPHYARHPIESVLTINGLGKFGIVPFGAGRKTFRHTEVTANSIMLTWKDNLAWSFPWQDGKNCFVCDIGEEVETIEELSTCDLYDVYRGGVENWKNYEYNNYIKHIESIINSF